MVCEPPEEPARFVAPIGMEPEPRIDRIALDAYGYKWFRTGGFNHPLRRERQ